MATEATNKQSLWTVAGGGPSRTGLFARPVRIDPKPTQRLAARGAVQASAVFDAEDRVFIADMAGWVQAFSGDGKPRWQQRLDGGVSATPAVDAGGSRVFVGTLFGWVYALRNEDGAVQWRTRVPTQSDPRIVSDLLFLPAQRCVILSSWGGQFHALDAASGESKHAWNAGISPQAGASADAEGNLYCLRAVRGEGVAFERVSPEAQETVLHRRPEGKRGANRMVVGAAPMLDESRGVAFFLVNVDHQAELHAWSLREQRLLWKREFQRMVTATPALGSSGNVIVADTEGLIHSLTPDGSPVFRYATGAEYLLAGPVCDAGGQTFAGDPLGRLHVVDKAGEGRVVFEVDRSFQARPAFDRRGNLYLPATDRTVYVFRNLASG